MNIETIAEYFPSLVGCEHDEVLLRQVESAKTNAKRVEMCVALLQPYSHHFEVATTTSLPSKDNDAAVKKFMDKANYCRKIGEYGAALEYYNKCLCFMDLSAVEVVAEIYWGRALIYYELKLRELCLENLRRAEMLGRKDTGLREKCLVSTSRKCEKASEPNLRYKSHRNIPFIIEDIALEYSDDFGYHLVAHRNLKPGDIIMMEKPYSAVVLPKDRYRKCATCLSSNYLNLLPCPGCNRAMFCSTECRMEGHRLFHRYECAIMEDIEKLLTPELMIALRNTLRGCCIFWSLDELAEVLQAERKRERDFMLDFCATNEKTNFCVVASQTTNEKLRAPVDLFHLSLGAATMYTLLMLKTDLVERIATKRHHDLIMELLLRFSQIATVNSFAIAGLPDMARRDFPDEVENEFAIATYPLSSFLNHSCAPNVTKTNVGENHETMLVFVTRPIKAGGQIFDCYFSDVHHYSTRRPDRQTILREQYNFTCFCEACERDFPIQRELLAKVPTINVMQVVSENYELKKFICSKEVIWRNFQRYCHALKNFNHLYPCKEIFVFYKCMMRCIWLLYKKEQLLYTPPKAQISSAIK